MKNVRVTKAPDTINVTNSLRAPSYQSISFCVAPARITTRLQVHALANEICFVDKNRDDDSISSCHTVRLFRSSFQLVSSAKSTALTFVNDVEFESARNDESLSLSLTCEGRKLYSFERYAQRRVTLSSFRLTMPTRLAANYASSPPARLALMTYRRQDSFVTTPQRGATRRDYYTRRYIQSATLGVTLGSFDTRPIDGGHEFEQTGGHF